MIFDMLKKDSFTEDWIVLHSLNLSQHTKRLYGEIDFLLLIPNAGVFVMEVKGGDVRCKNGEWEFIDRHGNVNRNKSPFNQARDAMFSLQTEIKKELGDVLLHLVFYAKIGSEKNSFDIADVINSLNEKLIFRHPHIYGNVEVKDEEEVKQKGCV